MCGCSCGGSAPTVIQCGAGTAGGGGNNGNNGNNGSNGNGGNNGNNGNGNTTNPPPVQRCSRLLVRVDSIHVSKADSFGVFAEWGAAEWRLTITVNDQSRTWSYDDVEDGRDYQLGYDFTIEIPNDNATVSIRASGFEDDLIGDDALPSSQRTHGSSDNYGVGGTRQLTANNSDFDYTINYTVTCLQNTPVSMISRQAMAAMVSSHVERRSADRKVKVSKLSEADALTVFVSRMASRGVKFARMDGDLAVFEGTRSVQSVAASVFPLAGNGNATHGKKG